MALGFVRPARPTDAGEIARLQLATWRHAYRHILPHRVLDGLDEDWMTRRWLASIDSPPTPRHRVLVAVEEADRSYLVGFIAAGEADETIVTESDTHLTGHAAISDLLVEPRWGRRGHGSRLLAACVDQWRTDERTTALAWAFTADVATNAFLGAAGWEPDGAQRALDMMGTLVPQRRLHTAL